MELEGQVVVITGAGSGIGRAACDVFAAEGAHVLAIDLHEDAAEAAAAAVGGGGSIVVTASVAGIVAFELNPLYTLTKQAVTGFVRAVAPSLTGSSPRGGTWPRDRFPP